MPCSGGTTKPGRARTCSVPAGPYTIMQCVGFAYADHSAKLQMLPACSLTPAGNRHDHHSSLIMIIHGRSAAALLTRTQKQPRTSNPAWCRQGRAGQGTGSVLAICLFFPTDPLLFKQPSGVAFFSRFNCKPMLYMLRLTILTPLLHLPCMHACMHAVRSSYKKCTVDHSS